MIEKQLYPTLKPRSDAPQKRVEQFLTQVRIDSDTGCWNWRGKTNLYGYGTTSYKGRSVAVHRLAWILYRTDLTPGLYIHHQCENHSCVNPEHLQSVTAEEHGIKHQGDRSFCKNGHPLNAENTYTFPGTKKIVCRACRRKVGAERHRKIYKKRDPGFQRTHCARGHEMTEENSYYFRGERSCKACHNITSLRFYHKKRKMQEPKELILQPDAVLREHCKYGHEFTPENTGLFTRPNGLVTRRCRTCDAAYARAWQDIKKGKVNDHQSIEPTEPSVGERFGAEPVRGPALEMGG